MICNQEFKVISWKHLTYKHKISIEEYDKKFGKINHSTTVQTKESVEKANKTKKEKGLKPWNYGLTKDNHPSLLKISKERIGKNNPFFKIKDKNLWISNIKKSLQPYNKKRKNKTLEEYHGEEKAKIWKKNLSNSAKKRKIHGHAGKFHTDETKEILRAKTTKRISLNKNKVSAPQLKLYNRLKESKIYKFELEYFCKFYALDIAIPSLKLCIEIDGDFWHVNENKGFKVKYECQKRNKRIEKSKTTYLTKNGWKILRIWVSDIESDFETVIKNIEVFIEKEKGEINDRRD